MSEPRVFTYLPERPPGPAAARLAPRGLTSLFLLLGKTQRVQQMKMLLQLWHRGKKHGANARGRAGIPQHQDPKQTPAANGICIGGTGKGVSLQRVCGVEQSSFWPAWFSLGIAAGSIKEGWEICWADPCPPGFSPDGCLGFSWWSLLGHRAPGKQSWPEPHGWL